MNPVREAIYGVLVTDVTLTGLLSNPEAIFHQQAPQDAEFPFVAFHKQAGTPRWQFDAAHIQNDLWTVKGISLGASASIVEDIAARIDLVLTDAALPVTGRSLLYLRRQSDVDYVETSGADTFRHCGAQYRVVTEPA